MSRRPPTSTLCPYTTLFFFFTDTATTEIYTLSLHDALPIYLRGRRPGHDGVAGPERAPLDQDRGDRPPSLVQVTGAGRDRKSTRLNSSHSQISYAVFCLKKKTLRRHAQT